VPSLALFVRFVSDARFHSITVILLPILGSKIALQCGHLICPEDFKGLGGKLGRDAMLPEESVHDSDADRWEDGYDSEDGSDSEDGYDSDDGVEPGEENAGPREIMVAGAGVPQANGIYLQAGYFEGACRYAMDGQWNGTQSRFYMFCRNWTSNPKHWYISTFPPRGRRGASTEISLYKAPANTPHRRLVPPLDGWAVAHYGVEGVPTFEHSAT
jgi:hypothetical protein